ncbi:MAG: DUF2341 domain-containing protein [Kiritimatiellae bacterium]|nr:DUF2341 domain-containing protein [Kiritimatiellia bacterium]
MNRFTVSAIAALSAIAAFADTSDYSKKLTMTVNSSRFAQSDGSVAALPVPVRLSTAISGFSYDDVVQTGSSKDLYFVDSENNVLPYEIEKWNEQGESIVWVRVPAYAAGAHIYMYYGGPAVAQNAAAVWSGYTGVWHMSEDSGTVADATGNNLDAVPAGDDTTQSVATAGPVGNGRVNASDNKANRLDVAYDSKLNIGDTLSFSGWAMLSGTRSDGRMAMVMHKEKLWEHGWGVADWPDTADEIWFWGNSNSDGWDGNCGEYLGAVGIPSLLSGWVHVTVTHSGNTGKIYINGEQWATIRSGDRTANSWIAGITDNDKKLSFGYTSNGVWDDGWTRPFQGAFDEFRLHDDVLDAARIKAEYVSQAYADALVYEVSEVLTGTVTLADAVTSGIVSENGKNTLTVTANVTAINGESAKVFLAVGVSEPKDGDPVVRMTGIVTNEVTAAGTTTFVWDGAVLGTKIAYAVMNVVGSTTNSTAVTVSKLADPAEYFWIADAEGYWSDNAHWTTSVSDGLPRLGYPSYGSRFQTRWGSKTALILVDAAYEDLQGGTTLGWRNDTITFRGTVEGAAIGYPEGSGFGDGQYDNTHITLDGVALTCGSYHVYHDASLTMLNGASLSTRWEFLVDGENASLYVGDGCELNQRGVDGNRFQLSGEKASIVVSNGLVRAKSLRLGARNDSDTGNVGKTPAGIRFEGNSPRLVISGEANIPLDIGSDIAVVFCIPENGYASAPIAKDSTSNRAFADRASSIEHGLAFSIDEKSPYLAVRTKFRQPLVDWTYNNTAYEVNADAISLAEMKYAPTARMYFTPEEGGATKSGVEAYCYTQKGFAVFVR